MKLSDHSEHIRQLIDNAFRNRLGRMGFVNYELGITNPDLITDDQKRIEAILSVLRKETGNNKDAFEKLIDELTFTLFNRIAALKVMEAHTLHPEIITRRSQHGDRSLAHFAWLEQNPQARHEDAEGIVPFLEEQLQKLSSEIPLFNLQHPYHLLPTALELSNIILAFNQVDNDPQVQSTITNEETIPNSSFPIPNSIWQSDDVLGWLYESYNNQKKLAHKESGDKTEYNKVSIQSQVYTPRWVVKFLVDNSLGKLYLEMYPDSEIKNKYKIANAPSKQCRERKPLREIRLMDPAPGSGNFLLYGFDLFYDLYIDQIENYGAFYDVASIPKMIIEDNLYGIDLDDRAVQLAQLGLYIKAKRKKRNVRINHFNIVSSDFYLPAFEEVRHLFESEAKLETYQEKIITSIWEDLQNAHKFGSLLRLEEKFNVQLHGLVSEFDSAQQSLFREENIASYELFRDNFFNRLEKALMHSTTNQGVDFLNSKTADAIVFLKLLTQKYDIAVANPPYTDSADFGVELKKFVEANYKQPYKFNSNLYAAFIRRCCEITTDDGYVGMIHPHTFMFIKTFEDVRKYLIEHTHIDLMVDYGLDRVNLFGPGILLDATWYVLSKKRKDSPGLYFNITANQQEKAKQASLEQAYEDALNNRSNSRFYTLPQEKLKIIEGWPFIYWISDGFREKFKEKALGNINKVATGLMTGDNDRFLRFFWEVDKNDLSEFYPKDKRKWVAYQKGGPFCRWYGNNWTVVNFIDNGSHLATTDNKRFYFHEGITYSASGSKGASFRYIEPKYVFDKGGACVFNLVQESSTQYLLAFLNSKLSSYIADCLNPTVNIQKGDIERIPFVNPSVNIQIRLTNLAYENIEIKRNTCSFRVTETNFEASPLTAFQELSIKDRVLAYLNFENAQLTQVLINEAIINELIFEVYELSDEDRIQVETKMGVSVGQLGITNEAIRNWELEIRNQNPQINETVLEHLKSLPIIEFEPEKISEIKEGFDTLYQSNNDLEEFCIRHQVNPINVWYWFKEANVLPAAKAKEIALEFLADTIRTILMEDEDGIIPLVGLPEEPRLTDRLEHYCLNNGFTSAQYLQLDGLLGRPINEYLEHHFFKDLSDHLNLFMYLPKTPFIWHLSSGEHQGFEAYIIIYKWNRDSLFKLKSHYISKRVENLEYRQIQLLDNNTAQAQNEKEKIRYQLHEIESFTRKIEELIAEGYNPVLDSGVGKNIAPLQKKGLLRAEVLKSAGKNSQLEKYLNADW